MEYEYTPPTKRIKISHTNDHFALHKQTNINNIVIQGSTSEDNIIVESFRKKLLVLDVNGLLVDIVPDPDEAHKPDTIIASKAVFKRPFCDDFLEFCFQRFSVGVWTSRTRKNINRVLDFLMRDTQHRLLFCWDQSHCTATGFNTIENTGKPLLLKELKKLWEKQDPNLPWDRGAYDESNTLLLDDSPYKALRNPPHTAIFPFTYSYRNAYDNDLGPNGDLRNYLEMLAASDNVQKFIEQNPFGQQPITHDNESWNFYHKIICSTQPGAGPSRSRKKLIVIDIGGLLVDVRTAPRQGFRADTVLGSKAVFKRPYCDEFLKFCFQRFNVGVWTSVFRSITEHALDYLLRDARHKLLFYWDLAHCTDTGFRTVENDDKMLLLKELRKLWEKQDPNLPWEIGEYDESNTLLVDTKSHRALLNPPHTAIFPYPYCHWHAEDKCLRKLRFYLERLAATENVQKFVSENPFGQRPIREKNLSWGFYQKIIRAFSHKCKAGDSVDVQCRNSSEPKPDTAIASVTKTLSEPKTNSSTALAAPTLLEPKPDSTATSAPPTILDPNPNSSTPMAAPTLLEPKPNSTASSDVHNLVEPETGTTTAFFGQVLSEPDLDTTALTAHTSLDEEAETTTALVGQTLSEPDLGTAALSVQTSLEQEADTTTALVSQTLSEPDLGTTALAAQTSLEQEAVTTAVLTAPNLLQPEIGTNTALVGQTLSEAGIGSTTVAAQTSLESETMATTMLTPPTLLKPDPAAANLTTSTMITSGAEDEKSYQNRKRRRTPKLVGLKESTALDGSVTCSTNKRVVNSVDDDSHGKRFRSSAGSNGSTKGFVLALETTGSNDGKSHQKRRGGPPKLAVKKPTSALKDEHGITADLEEQEPLSVWLERMRTLSVLKRSSRPSLSDHRDKSVNQAIATTSGTTADYQQDWPFIKLCPIWATIESLVPQKPHFSPLKKTNELCREGLAVAHMMTYWSLVQRLPDLKPDDPTDIINSLEVLVDLETHGFDVDAIRGRLNELLYLKSKAGQHDDTLKELEKRNYEKLVLQNEMDRLKAKMQKLQEKMAQAETKLKAKEEESLTLQSNLHPVSTQIND